MNDPKAFQLSKNEVALILAIRTRFRYGEVTILMRDGIPLRIVRAFDTEELAKQD